jgi:hypothetical protein
MLQEINNILINENFIFSKFSDCKYKISLLSIYLMDSFNVINDSIEHTNNLLELLTKNIKKSNERIENSFDLNTESTEDKCDEIIYMFKDIYKNNIGKYHWKIRALKIIRYKLKLINRMKKIPIIKKFSGRSKVASMKPRLHGRFIKKS